MLPTIHWPPNYSPNPPGPEDEYDGGSYECGLRSGEWVTTCGAVNIPPDCPIVLTKGKCVVSCFGASAHNGLWGNKFPPPAFCVILKRQSTHAHKCKACKVGQVVHRRIELTESWTLTKSLELQTWMCYKPVAQAAIKGCTVKIWPAKVHPGSHWSTVLILCSIWLIFEPRMCW